MNQAPETKSCWIRPSNLPPYISQLIKLETNNKKTS